MLANLSAQNFYDINTIQTIEITFAQSNWDQLLDAAYSGSGDYIMAESVSINGTLFDSVGVKYKGNSTYQSNQTKNPFHIELDTFKDHIYENYTDIKLSNVAKDPSFLREVLSYQILRQYMDAPLSNYANVYVNGSLIGLYSNSEAVSKKFVNNRFGSKSNTFIKCNPPDGAGPGTNALPNLVYLGQDSSNYDNAYELKSDDGWQDLINLCDTLSNATSEIEKILDVDRVLWMLAFDNILVNLDSYIGGFAQNYYLYKDDYQRFLPVVWDLNESFGRFAMTGSGQLNSTTAKQQMSHLLNANDADFPLVQKLFSVPMYKRMYLAHCKTMLLENFDNSSYYSTGQSLQALIDAAVQADGNKFFSYNNFLSNLTTDISGGGGPGGGTTPGITNLMDARNTYLLDLSDFTQSEPAITNINLSDTMPILGETIVFTASITNADNVYLGYRSAEGAPFQRVPMFDDGTHDDGAANDGIYGINLVINSFFTQYYIYAENSGIGLFSPRRAEYEYHTVQAIFSDAGDLVINELMASNVQVISDQDGEYDDWIELFNNSNSTLDIGGYFLSDDATELMKWALPAGTQINSLDYLIVWADKDDNQAGLHASFKLSSGGETLFLSDATGIIVDQISFPAFASDLSYARIPNGTGSFQIADPTYNSQNDQSNNISVVNRGDSKMIVIPNPAAYSFQLNFGDEVVKEREVIVYDLSGKVVFQDIIDSSESINCTTWPAGMYVARSGSLRSKIIVRR